MAVDKINGFKAPYRSATFQGQADHLAGDNGLLTMDGDVYTDSGNVHIPPHEFVQNGLLVSVDTERLVSEPVHPAPYFLAVTAVTTAQTDDLQYSFPRSPYDISPNHAVIAYWDGLEWRKPQMLSIDEVNNDLNQSNVDFERFGPVSGLFSRVNGPNYETDPGVIVDRQGLRQRLDTTFTTSIIANDNDFDRVDRIVYQRPEDDEYRIGFRKFVLGGAHAVSPTGLYNTEVFDGSKLNLKPKVLIGSDNAAHLVSSTGYGELFGIQYAKYDAARTSEIVAPLDLVVDIDNPWFDAVLDKNNNLHVIYANGGSVYWKKFDSTGALVTGPHEIYSGTVYPAGVPRVAYNASEDSFFVVFEANIAPSDYKIYFTKILNSAGIPAVSVPPVQLSFLPGIMRNPDITVTDDLDVYIIAEETSAGKICFRRYSYLGDNPSDLKTISSNTEQIGVGTLVDSATKPRIFVSDNKVVFATFLQEIAAGIYGLGIWSEDYAFTQEMIGVGENFSDYDVVIDGFLNGIHLILREAAAVHYVKIEGSDIQFTYEIDTVAAGGVSLARDQLGAMLHAWSKPAAGTFSVYDSGVTVDYVGDHTGGGALPGGVEVQNNEFLVQQTSVTPKVGDRVVISGSVAVDGTYEILSIETETVLGTPYWRCSTNPVFPASEDGVSGDFEEPDGNASHFIKTNSELTSLAYRFNTLPTDLLLARLSLPGPVVLNYGDSAVGPQPAGTDKLVVYGDGTILDWGQTGAGDLTISGPGLHIIDMVNNTVYDVANGSYPMVEGQALYVELDLFTTSITPQVTDVATLDWSSPIQVLGVIKQGVFAPHSLLTAIGIEELEDGEANELGEALPGIIRERLGILSDTQFQPYLNNYGIFTTDDYATAISKLDALVHGFNTDTGDVEYFEVSNPAGQDLFQATKFVWDGDNSVVDIDVFVNGKYVVQALDGSLTEYSYHKVTEDQIQFHYTLPLKAQVFIRKHRTGGGNAGFLETFEEGVQVHARTQKLNFTGPGVEVANGGTGQTNVHVFGDTEFGKTLIKNYKNTSGSAIPAGSVVAFDDDGGIVPADANVTTLSDLCGVTIDEITANNFGSVYKLGDCPGVLATLGATPGKLVYMGEAPGSMSLTPPTGLSDSIIILGRAEPPSAAAPDGSAPDLYLNPQIITGGGV